MTLLYFLLMISALIFFHELGHYTFARIAKVHVVTFSIGFGKPLIQWQRKGTSYQFCLIPLGGYVKLLGDDPHEEIPPELEDAAFLKKSLWHRFWIIFGGPLFISSEVIFLLPRSKISSSIIIHIFLLF